MLKRGSAKRIDSIKETCMLEGLTKRSFDELKSPRVLNTHIYFKHIPKDLLRKNVK